MEGLCLIVSGGDFCPPPAELCAPKHIIACDRGYLHARRLGLTPDLIVGDFDSAPPPRGAVSEVRRVPARKDDTDTMLAAREALALGYRDVAVCCAFGGRLDHTLANLQTAAFLAERGCRVRLSGTDTDARVFTSGREAFPRREGWSLSVFALSDRCEGVTLRGTAYECENAALTNGFPLGVSNVWAAEEAAVGVARGTLLVLQSRLKKGEHI